MKKLVINNPNSYTSSATDTAMVSYQVSGSKELIAQYERVKGAELAKVDKELSYADEEQTIPLFHTTLDNACKIKEEGTLIFSVNDKGEETVYADITAYKLQEDRINSCKDKARKALLLMIRFRVSLSTFTRIADSHLRASRVADVPESAMSRIPPASTCVMLDPS